MNAEAVIEAAREFVRAEESENMAQRQQDARWLRSAREVRAIALARLKEAVTAYDAATGRPEHGPGTEGESR